MDWIRYRDGKMLHVFLRAVTTVGVQIDEYEKESNDLTFEEQDVVMSRLSMIRKDVPLLMKAVNRTEQGSIKDFEIAKNNGKWIG